MILAPVAIEAYAANSLQAAEVNMIQCLQPALIASETPMSTPMEHSLPANTSTPEPPTKTGISWLGSCPFCNPRKPVYLLRKSDLEALDRLAGQARMNGTGVYIPASELSQLVELALKSI